MSEPRSVEVRLRDAFEPLDDAAGGVLARGNRQEEEKELVKEELPATEDPQKGLFDAPASTPNAGEAAKKELSETWREQYGLHARAPPFLSEHLSLVSRWFYSKPRDGEILFRTGDWPYRRILRACARLLNPQEKSLAPPAPAPPPEP